MSEKNRKKLFAALIVGIFVSCISLGMFKKMQKQIEQQDAMIKIMSQQAENTASSYTYVIAQRDMGTGETVSDSDINTAVFYEKQEDGLENTDMAAGNVLLEPVKKGQILTGYVFTGINNASDSTGVRKGYRALTISTDKMDGLSAAMTKGKFVDIFSKTSKNPYELQNVRILSFVPSNSAEKEASSIIKSQKVTLEIPSAELKDFVKAYSSNSLLLVLRPSGEKAPAPSKRTVSAEVSQNYYEKPVMPKLPDIKDIDALPAPASFQGFGQSVEVIEANTKTKVEFN